MSDNPYMRRALAKGKMGHGTTSEARVAKKLNARLTPASGAMRGAKGDARTDRFVIECKSTTGDFLRLDLGWLVKVAHEAMEVGRDPALAISFVTPEGKAHPMGDWVAVPRVVFQQLVEGE